MLRSLRSQLGWKGNVRVIAVQTLVSQLGFGMFSVVWQPYILSTGASVIDLGVIQSTVSLSTAVGLIAWGFLSDRFGRKPIILLSNAFRVLSIVALVLSGELFFLLLFAFLIGFSSLFYVGNPARNALISESVDGQSRATVFSTITFISQITNTVTASAGGYIAVKAGYQPIFYACIAFDLMGMVLLASFLRETLPETEREKKAAGGGQTMGALMPERGLMKLYLIMIIMGLGYGTGYAVFYGSLVDTYGLSPLQLGLLSTVFNLVGAASSIPFGRLSDRYGRRPFLKASWMMGTVTVLGFLASRNLNMFLLFSVTNALDMSFFLSAWMAFVFEKAPPGGLSTVIGKLDSYSRLVSIPAPWLAGILYTSHGFAAPLLIQLACLTLSGALIFSLKEQSPRTCIPTN